MYFYNYDNIGLFLDLKLVSSFLTFLSLSLEIAKKLEIFQFLIL